MHPKAYKCGDSLTNFLEWWWRLLLLRSDLRLQGTPEGCAIIRADDLQEWQFSIEVLGNSLYQNEKFALRFRFTDSYPMESPEVVFIVTDGYKAPIVSSFSISCPPSASDDAHTRLLTRNFALLSTTNSTHTCTVMATSVHRF